VYLHGVLEFLKDYPGMSIGPSREGELILKGNFRFKANLRNGPVIEDSYTLEISITDRLPLVLPSVKETGNKIPRDGNHHVNPDHTLCLGSPLRLLGKINTKPNLIGFAENCLVPYLYAISHKIQNGGDFIFGELAHGEKGAIDDYIDLFGLKNREQVVNAINLLGIKKRLANKKPCPCGCGKRLGACSFHFKLNNFRKMAPKSWFSAHAKNIRDGM
jgi:hypothetical protein